jgi:hypothetical protein
MRITVNINDANNARLFVEGFPHQATRAIRHSIRRAIYGVRTDAAYEVRKTYNVKSGVIKKSFKLSFASDLLSGSATTLGKRIPLINFGGRPMRPIYPPPSRGVSVKVKQQRKFIDEKDGKLPFVARMKSGHVGIFRRDEEYSLPIKELYGPSIPSMVGTDKNDIKNRLQRGAINRFNKNLDHAIDRVLRR